MTESNAPAAFKPKKSVALSGVPAGNTALCSVGRTGNDLHYRGYNILDLAPQCTFEEIAYLLIHGTLPTQAELTAYQAKLAGLRGLPAALKAVLEQLPPASHPMDVMRTAASALGCLEPEKIDQPPAAARDIADRLIASGPSMPCSTGITFAATAGASKSKPTTTDRRPFSASAPRQAPPPELWVRAMHSR
jgi:2-methylcitrate synthase